MDQFEYFPILRWKGGEQGAVKNLASSIRSKMLPVAELQEIEPVAGLPKLARSLLACSADSLPIAIDAATATDIGKSVRSTVRAVKVLQAEGLHVWPAIRGLGVLADSAATSLLKGQPAIVIRISPYELSLSDISTVVTACRHSAGNAAHIYLILDLGAIGEIDAVATAALLATLARGVIAGHKPFQVIYAGGSFPMTLSGIPKGINNHIPRKEMAIWRKLRAEPECASVKFGDYTVTNPQPLPAIDPRTMNPSAAIRYCLADEWWLPRASGVRTTGRGGFAQYNDLCKLLIKGKAYCGSAYSFGDARYAHHAQPGTTSGNFTTWRRDAVNHHLTFTMRQLAGGLGAPQATAGAST